jgi:hypothetical protein
VRPRNKQVGWVEWRHRTRARCRSEARHCAWVDGFCSGAPQRFAPRNVFAHPILRAIGSKQGWSSRATGRGRCVVQATKAKARGYRSTRNLKAIIYLIAGKLDLALPT